MSVLIDTSGLLALLNANDERHNSVRTEWAELVAGDEPLVSTSYILIETFALAQNRLGLDAVRTLQEDIYPVLTVEWIGPDLHQAGVHALLTAGRRQLSLVHCVSFETMRRRHITSAFCLDAHFREHGFEVVPSDAGPARSG